MLIILSADSFIPGVGDSGLGRAVIMDELRIVREWAEELEGIIVEIWEEEVAALVEEVNVMRVEIGRTDDAEAVIAETTVLLNCAGELEGSPMLVQKPFKLVSASTIFVLLALDAANPQLSTASSKC